MFGMHANDSVLPNTLSESKYEVKSVVRALRLLDILAENGVEGLTVTEAAAQLGASKSATFALLQTLVGAGYGTGHDPGPRYRLGPAVLRLADSHTHSTPLVDLARPAMLSLTEQTGWTSRLAIHENGYPVFIDRVEGRGSIRFYTPLGIRELPHHSAAGKAILAGLAQSRVRSIAEETGLPQRTRHTITDIDSLLTDLSRVRTRGFAVDDEEDDQGVLCVGAAFRGRDGQPAGALSITGLKADLPDWRVQELGGVVRDHADRVTRALGGSPWQPEESSQVVR